MPRSKVEPCYEDCKCVSIIGCKKDGLICQDSVCIEDEPIIVPSETVRLKTVWHSCLKEVSIMGYL